MDSLVEIKQESQLIKLSHIDQSSFSRYKDLLSTRESFGKAVFAV